MSHLGNSSSKCDRSSIFSVASWSLVHLAAHFWSEPLSTTVSAGDTVLDPSVALYPMDAVAPARPV
jgi:hypothetical protein